MKKYLIGLVGLAAFAASSLLGQTLACGGESCYAEAACDTGCNGNCNGGCNNCCHYCPRCGCQLQPVCQMTCETKKTTEHKYCCECKDVCIPGVTRIGERCGGCDNSGACGGGCAAGCNACDPANNGCQDNCDCRCRVRTVHKLMVCPVTKETQVKACTVTWTCPNCGGCGGCGEGTAVPGVGPAAPAPTAPAPPPSSNRLPPAPPKTTNLAPMPEDIHTARTGY
jgi:hypothetical protein